MTGQKWILPSIAVLALVLGVTTAAYITSRDQKIYAATVLPNPRPLREFELVDHNGEPFTKESLRGGWNLLFFGFTNCPDVCPTTLHMLRDAGDALAGLPDEQRPRAVFVSVDPMRDTPEVMFDYVSFAPGLIGVTGELSAIQILTTDLGVAVNYTAMGDTYTVDHTASLFLTDPDGRLYAIFNTPHDGEQIVADLRKIVTAGSR